MEEDKEFRFNDFIQILEDSDNVDIPENMVNEVEKYLNSRSIPDTTTIDKETDERIEYLKARMFEEKEFRCVKCLKVFHVAGRSLWAPYTCPDCSMNNLNQ